METFKNDIKLAMSIAFSWGSIIVLIFGMNMMQTRGLGDYILYSINGSICLSIFGYIYHKGWLHQKCPENPLVKLVMIGMQVITLLFQMKLIHEFFVPLIGTNYAHVLATSVGLIFVWWMYKRGLITSIITDNWQGSITMISLILAIGYCVWTNCPTYDVLNYERISWQWGVWSLITIPSALVCDLQHWRRAEIDHSHRAYYYATAIYFFVFILIGGIAVFKIPTEVRLFLIIPVLGFATSTIDSIAVAMHECYDKKVGSVVCSLICCFWWAVMGESLMYLWNSMATFRLCGAITILLCSYYYYHKVTQEKSRLSS